MITRVFYIRLGNANRVRLVDRTIVDRVIREHDFQVGDWSNAEKTAEFGKALNADWVVRGIMERFDTNILVTVEFFDILTLEYRGGADLLLANANAVYQSMDTLVEKVVETITGGGRPPGGTGTTTNIPPNFVRIQGGTFLMGSPSNEPESSADEGPQHQVTVNSFYMSRHEVTQREYQEVMGTNPSFFRGDNLPVDNVSWYDAVEYCNRRSEREGLTTAYTIDRSRSDPNNHSERDTVRWLITWNRNANGYRLPTEAEWEYACRAGTVTPFSTGNNITTSLANYDGRHPYNGSYNASGTSMERTTPVGSFAPNPWGLYDMHGNVFEWCWDWYGNYSSGAQDNPQGAVSGSGRVMRGGSWSQGGWTIRSAYRTAWLGPVEDGFLYGFRLVRNAQ
jgi:formylglycine-generating enzyme required for sulfatase activity